MAGIDKTYCTLEEYKTVREWWIKLINQQVKDLDHAIWLSPLWVYTDDGEHYRYAEDIPLGKLEEEKDFEQWDDSDKGHPIWNTSIKEDLWLSVNCDIDFIQKRLHEQYGEDWIGFTHRDKIDFKDIPFIAEIRLDNDNPIYFFKEHKDGTSEVLRRIIFYGTTYLLKIFHEAIRTLYLGFETSDINYIIFNYYGITIKYDQKIYTDVESNDEVIVSVDDREFFEPVFKHSYDIKESDYYVNQEIFMSHENEAFDITQYKNSSRYDLPKYIRLLPDYVRKNVHVEK